MATKEKNWKKLTIISSIVLSLLLLVANSGYWVNKYVFDANNFAAIATSSLTSQSSRAAIANGIVARAFEAKPVAAKILSEPVSNLVEGLLGTNLSEKAVYSVSEKVNIMVTSKEKRVISFDLTGVKSVLERISSTAGERSPEKFDASLLPDEVTIVDGKKLPDLYQYSIVMLWLTPITLLLALGTMAAPYILFRRNWRGILSVQALAIIASGMLALAVGPLFRPIILANITDALPRTVIGNLYDSFMTTYSSQSRQLILIGIVALIVAGIAYAYPYTAAAIKNRTQKTKPAK